MQALQIELHQGEGRIAAAVGRGKEESKGFGGVAGGVIGNLTTGDD